MEKNKKVLKTILLVLIIFAIGFFIYTQDYYKAQENYIQKNNLNILEDETIFLENESSNIGIIFYPGAKVEYFSYYPLMEKLHQQTNANIFMTKMPFNMAIFDQNKASEVIGKYPNLTTWYVAGHSMGGAMASGFASSNPEKVEGLILLGAYLYGDYNPKDALTIYGSLNESVEEKIDYTENVFEIEGGNHAYFGNYGEQKGDPKGLISREEQQNITVEIISEFIN